MRQLDELVFENYRRKLPHIFNAAAFKYSSIIFLILLNIVKVQLAPFKCSLRIGAKSMTGTSAVSLIGTTSPMTNLFAPLTFAKLGLPHLCALSVQALFGSLLTQLMTAATCLQRPSSPPKHLHHAVTTSRSSDSYTG